MSSSVSTWGDEACFGTPVGVPRVVRPGPAWPGDPIRPNRQVRVERARAGPGTRWGQREVREPGAGRRTSAV